MEINAFSWKVRGPLKRLPVRGPLFGAIVAGFWGAVAELADVGQLSPPLVLGVIVPGALAGLTVGLTLPWWTGRIRAGFFSGLAATVFYSLYHWQGRDELALVDSIFLGVCTGIAFGALLWDYSEGK